MRHLMTGVRNGAANLPRLTFRRVSGLLAVAGMMALAPVFAKDPAESDVKAEVKTNRKDRSETEGKGNRKGKADHRHGHAEAAAIPECLEKLNLSPEQELQVKEIVGNYDASTGKVWHQFSDRYMQTIKVESLLLAAIEDNLTEPQRQQVRDQRRKTAQHEKMIAATGTTVNQAEVKPNEETTKPATAAEEGLAVVEVSRTDEQEAAADKVQEKYRNHLRSLNRDIQGLHTRLVSLEADKLVEIEKVLTKEQLMQLRMHRQNAPVATKLAVSKNEPTKSE